MPVGNTPTTGADTQPEGVVVQAPEPVAPEILTISPQAPGSDTVVTPTPPDEPSRPVSPPSEQEVELLRQRLVEQTQVQAGLDRARTKLQAQVDAGQEKVKELTGKLAGYTAATTGNEAAISELEQEVATQREEAARWQAKAETAIGEHERLKVVTGEYMGDNPIARLVQTGALPQAETLDELREKMNTIVEGFGSAAESQYIYKMQGVRPPASPPASPPPASLDSLKERMDAAQTAGDTDKFNKLKDQWYETLNTQGLPPSPADQLKY